MCYISHLCREAPDDAIFTKFDTAIDLTDFMTSANFGCDRLRDVHSAVVQNLPFPYDFNDGPYNRQALTCCRDHSSTLVLQL